MYDNKIVFKMSVHQKINFVWSLKRQPTVFTMWKKIWDSPIYLSQCSADLYDVLSIQRVDQSSNKTISIVIDHLEAPGKPTIFVDP